MKKQSWKIQRRSVEHLMLTLDGIAATSLFSNGVNGVLTKRPTGPSYLRRTTMNIAMYVRVSTQRQAQTQTIEQQLDPSRI